MKAKLLIAIKVLLVLTTMSCAGIVVWAVYRYSHSDPRFSVKQVSVTGLTRVSEDDVMSRVKLRTDSNTNIFAVDLDDIRTQVEQIQWVRFATVSRVLPDQIQIHAAGCRPLSIIAANEPIAAKRIPVGSGTATWANRTLSTPQPPRK